MSLQSQMTRFNILANLVFFHLFPTVTAVNMAAEKIMKRKTEQGAEQGGLHLELADHHSF